MSLPQGVGRVLPDELPVAPAAITAGHLVVIRFARSRRQLAVVRRVLLKDRPELGPRGFVVAKFRVASGRWTQDLAIPAEDVIALYHAGDDHRSVLARLCDRMPPALRRWWNTHGIADPAEAAHA